ncbi:MAG: septation protein SepH [Micrococcaceae bacterium]
MSSVHAEVTVVTNNFKGVQMKELRLSGVDNDGDFLILINDKGKKYRVAIDEKLRAATTRKDTSNAKITEQTKDKSPKTIQRRLRAGESPEAVAEATGANIETIKRYEAPILAERTYIIERVQNHILGRFTPEHGVYWAEFGDDDVTLAELVSYELDKKNIKHDTIFWDSWRIDDVWKVQLTFSAPFEATDAEETAEAEEIKNAIWNYNNHSRHVAPLNSLATELTTTQERLQEETDHDVFDVDALPEEEEIPEPKPVGGPKSGEDVTNRRFAIAKKYPNLFGEKDKFSRDISDIDPIPMQQTIELGDAELSNVLSMSDHLNKPKSVATSEKVTPITDHFDKFNDNSEQSDPKLSTDSAEDADIVRNFDTEQETESDKSAEMMQDEQPDENAQSTENSGKTKKPKNKKRTKIPSWDDIVFGPKDD